MNEIEMKIEDFEDIIYEKEESGLCTATINAPKRKNAMSILTFFELETILEDMEADKNAQVLILTGSNEANAFSSGGYFNFKYLTSIPPEIMEQIDKQDIALKALCKKFWNFSKPVIAAINGLAIGAGATIPIVGADLIYMAEDAWFGFTFVKRAMMNEFGSSLILPLLLGLQKTKEFLYFGKKLMADEAEQLGLVNKVLTQNDLMTYAKEQALRLIPPKGPSVAIRLMKKTMHEYYKDIIVQTLDLENEGLLALMKTSDFRASMKSLVTKKPPVFKGR